jgi:hypothetical protein
MRHLSIVLLLLAIPLAAQEEKKAEAPKAEPPVRPKVEKLFILKYADPGRLANLLQIFGCCVTQSDSLHALAVTNFADTMPAIEDAIKRLDVPAAEPQNIELTAYYVTGGNTEDTPNETLPKDLEPVVTQLKTTFPFKSYHLMDVLTLRCRAGQGGDTSGVTAGPTARLPTSTQLKVTSVGVNGGVVRIDKLHAAVHLPVGEPGSYQYMDLGVNSDVDIKEGQKVVVGRLGINRDQALFVVLTARVVN